MRCPWDLIEVLIWMLISHDVVGAISVREDIANIHPDLFDSNFMLKPIREVVDDHKVKDFPKIYACGPDESQNWYEGDPDDCSGYFVCTGTYYIHRWCQRGLLFDTAYETCNWPGQVDCGERPLPWDFPEYEGPAHFIYHSHDKHEDENEEREETFPMVANKLVSPHTRKIIIGNRSAKIAESIPPIFQM